ncbi:MAG: 6-carboxytetrahydropterin synthase, partial [Candidatus Eremiobacteraeota bacterium]|nr:6-carboxytetrahydropterin synthase [Candidatus Eremiobacteraeota bacterium]
VIDLLDHSSLNDLMKNPTSENIVLWIWDQLATALDGLAELVLWETATACAVLRRDDL